MSIEEAMVRSNENPNAIAVIRDVLDQLLQLLHGCLAGREHIIFRAVSRFVDTVVVDVKDIFSFGESSPLILAHF